MRRRYKFKPKKRVAPRYRVNEQIRFSPVVVIDGEGKNHGEMEVTDALELAREQEMDLIEVSPNARPPVCKIMDYGKFQYQKSKQQRSSQAKQKKVDTKGVRIRVRTEEHDKNFKKAQVEKFLTKGNKVKIEIVLRGREKAHQDLARETLQNFIKEISVPHRTEEEVKKFPQGFNTLIAPQ